MREFCSFCNPWSALHHSSSLNNSEVADITQSVTSTQSATQRQILITPTDMPGTSSRSTPAPGGISQTHSMGRVVSSLAFGIASAPTALSGLENLSTSILNAETHVAITNPLPTRATERNQRQRQWQLQSEAVLHLDERSPAVIVSIVLVTRT
jgi:hypothetical protein